MGGGKVFFVALPVAAGKGVGVGREGAVSPCLQGLKGSIQKEENAVGTEVFHVFFPQNGAAARGDHGTLQGGKSGDGCRFLVTKGRFPILTDDLGRRATRAGQDRIVAVEKDRKT